MSGSVSGGSVPIRVLSAPDLRARRAAFKELLVDAVHAGASVGFLPPLGAEEADTYWHGVGVDVRMGTTILLAAFEREHLLGAVQLSLAHQANATHRAEIRKLLVHSRARRMGIGIALMQAAENEAFARGRHLLVLDTERASAAESLYRKLNWQPLGVIPRYALSADKTLHDTVFFYKEIYERNAL